MRWASLGPGGNGPACNIVLDVHVAGKAEGTLGVEKLRFPGRFCGQRGKPGAEKLLIALDWDGFYIKVRPYCLLSLAGECSCEGSDAEANNRLDHDRWLWCA